ncbi:unnamed protein product [Orchesella dallaii]|uniref:Death domain-containing protein n=1 Tax=Orchesella dallaii TaxID=48710 RepID=A0ABP1R300_9HEXA
MANLKVGSSECSRTLVIHTLFSGSTNSELVKNWRIVASTLGVPSEDTEPLRMRYSNGTLPIKELYEDVLTLWTGVKQDAATISALITALETHETLRDAAGLLRAKFLRESSSNEGSGTGGSKTSSTETMDDKRIRHITRNQDRLSKVTMLRIGILTKLLSSGYFSDEDLETLVST